MLCDIEGAERELLDPLAAPALLGIDMIVECHDGAAKLLTDRFTSSHDITPVADDGLRRLQDAPAWFRGLAPPRSVAGHVGVAQRRDAVAGDAGARLTARDLLSTWEWAQEWTRPRQSRGT